jgi:hypothetical protein
MNKLHIEKMEVCSSTVILRMLMVGEKKGHRCWQGVMSGLLWRQTLLRQGR